MSIISNNLVYLRKKSGRKAKEVAEMAGVKATTYNNYERGVSNPDSDLLLRISKIHGISLEDLVSSQLSDSQLPRSSVERDSIIETQLKTIKALEETVLVLQELVTLKDQEIARLKKK